MHISVPLVLAALYTVLNDMAEYVTGCHVDNHAKMSVFAHMKGGRNGR